MHTKITGQGKISERFSLIHYFYSSCATIISLPTLLFLGFTPVSDLYQQIKPSQQHNYKSLSHQIPAVMRIFSINIIIDLIVMVFGDFYSLLGGGSFPISRLANVFRFLWLNS